MADRAISELTPVTGVNADDSFVLQQNNRAMRLTGQVLLNWLAAALDGHGGINSIAKTGTQGITDTYTITFADQSTATFTVTNGKGVVSIAKTGTTGLVDTYTITYNDQTTSTFTVNNGKGIVSIEKTNTTGLIDTYTITYNDQTTTTFTVKNGNGIASIEKTGTSGLVDTYTVTMTNGTTAEFTVTNGEKGDKGDNTYTYVMYSTDSPDADVDMHPTPDNWMGIYCGPAATAPTSYTAYQWFRIKGEKGDRGDDVSITTATVRYAVSESGTEIPTEWSETIPAIPQGYYLWTRRQIVYSTGTNTTEYSITRNGIDGLGSVSSVNNLSPDSHGNVELPIDTTPVLNSGNLITSGAVATVKNTAELNLALPYSPTGTYVVGQPCIHNGRYYECISPIEIGEEWTPEHWDAPQIGDKLKQQAENLSDEVQRLSEIMSIVSTSDGKAPKAITSGQFVIWNGTLYTASTNIASGATLSTSNLTAVSSDGFNALKGLIDQVKTAFNTDALAVRGSINSANDLNNLDNQTTGIYRIAESIPQHCPVGFVWCFLIQIKMGSVTNQVLLKPSSGSIYVRELTGSPAVWSDWILVSGRVNRQRITYGNNSYVDYWKNGNIGQVYVKYSVSDGVIPAWNVKTIATVPEGFRPYQETGVFGINDREADMGTYISVNSVGAVSLGTRFNELGSSGGVIQASIVFPIMA